MIHSHPQSVFIRVALGTVASAALTFVLHNISVPLDEMLGRSPLPWVRVE